MIATNKTLQAGPDPRVLIVLAKFIGLIGPTLPITKIGRHKSPEVDSETFFRTFRERKGTSPWSTEHGKYSTYKPIARA